MGQFKNFAIGWVKREPGRAALVQRVLADAKALRAGHLSNLGTQSYGSYLRKNLIASRVHVIGAGHLVQEITPYLEKSGRVILHTRRPVQSHLEVRALNDRAFDGGALVIAAPVSAKADRRVVGATACRRRSSTCATTRAPTWCRAQPPWITSSRKLNAPARACVPGWKPFVARSPNAPTAWPRRKRCGPRGGTICAPEARLAAQ